MNRPPVTRTVLALVLATALILGLAAFAQATSTTPYIWITSQPGGHGIDIKSVSATSSSDVWAVGNTSAASPGGILHFDGTSWTTSASGLPAMSSVCALDAKHVWAVGANTIEFFDGATWHEQGQTSGFEMRSVFALDPAHVWAVGNTRNVYFYDGASWTSTALSITRALNSVFALDPMHVWAVGDGGTIVAWDGHVWADQSVGGANAFRGVTGLDSNCVWAVGDGGAVRYWNGAAWTESPLQPADARLSGVVALDVNHVYVSADAGRAFLWDVSAWQVLRTTGDSDYQCVAAIDTDHIYLAGTAGTFAYGYSALEARACNYYFAEGTCRPNFDPYLCVQNPNDSVAADIRVTYMLGSGATKVQTFTVPADSRYTVAVKGFLGQGNDAAHDFSAQVTSTNGAPIIAERPMYFSYTSSAGALITGGSDVVGALQPGPTFYFAEGTCRRAFDSYF